jgi:uncharacterized membrane protein YbaN (DUF454 family)
MNIFQRFKRKWIRLFEAPPGRRFQNYYRRTHRHPESREIGPRIGRLILALVFLVVGICLILFPLIYIPFLAASAAMLAAESRRFARGLDKGEVWARDKWASIQKRLGLSQRTVRITMGALGFGCLFLAGRMWYGTFAR